MRARSFSLHFHFGPRRTGGGQQGRAKKEILFFVDRPIPEIWNSAVCANKQQLNHRKIHRADLMTICQLIVLVRC